MAYKIKLYKNEELIFEGSFTAPSVSLGKSSDNDIILDEPHLSRHHARIEFDGTSFKVESLSSFKKILINGEKSAEGMLNSGQSFSIPPFRVEVHAQSEFPIAAAPATIEEFTHVSDQPDKTAVKDLGIAAFGQEDLIVAKPHAQKKKKRILILAGTVLVLTFIIIYFQKESSDGGKKPAGVEEQKTPFEELSADEKLKIQNILENALEHLNNHHNDLSELLSARELIQSVLQKAPDYQVARDLFDQVNQTIQEVKSKMREKDYQLELAQRKAYDLVGFHVNTATEFYRAQKFHEALDELDKAKAVDPDHYKRHPQAIALENIIQHALTEKKQEKKQQDVTAKNSALAKSYLNQGNALYAAQNYSRAIEMWQKAASFQGKAYEKYRLSALSSIKKAGDEIYRQYAAHISQLHDEFQTLFPKEGRGLAEVPNIDAISLNKNQYKELLQKLPPVTAQLIAERGAIQRNLAALDNELHVFARRMYYESLLSESEGDVEEAVKMWKDIARTNKFNQDDEFVQKSLGKLRKYGR
ncbi:MAG: FHA domain-containing protein [Deltaproteobacteria bacterium]|nr:FHA domain-containing protein [Deltaproteobacteria bacterium]